MASPSPFQERTFIPANPTIPQSTRPRQRPAPSSAAKRGRKPRSATLDSPLPTSPDALPSNPSAATSAAASPATTAPIQWAQAVATSPVAPVAAAAAAATAPVTPASDVPVAGPSSATSAPPGPQRSIGAMEEEVEGEDELLPAMADDDYSAQLSWQSQSKDNLKCVIVPSFFYRSFNSTLLGYSWTTSHRSSTSVSRHIAVMPSRSRPFERYDTTSNPSP